jgi:hypothetical protein
MAAPEDFALADPGAGADAPAAQRSPAERLLDGLLTTLIERTEEGSAAWEVDDAHPDSFCLVGDGWAVATRSVDGDGTHPYALLVAGATGEAVLEVHSTSAFGRPLVRRFGRLHAAAAATATMAGSAELVAAIVSALERPAGT